MKKLLWFFLVLGWLLPPLAHAQTGGRSVTGVVTALDDRSPLPGVNVIVKGTTNGVQTGADGRYTLPNVPEGSTLVFSFIGYAAQERQATDGTIDVALATSSTNLKEVYVTSAFGIEKEKRTLVTSAQQVQGKELIDSRQPNIVNALQGKIAGVNITSSGGGPGEGAAIVIRGGTSLDGDNQPLFVIDGVIMDNSSFAESIAPGGGSSFNGILGRSVGTTNRASDINPEDVESMTVLKGPAAAVLYGLRAANGAVIIKTKSGQAGRTSLTYRTQFSVDEVNRLPRLQDQYKQGTAGIFDPATRLSWGPRFAPNEEVFDNLQNFYQKGTSFQNYLTLTGGSDRASFLLSVQHLDSKGITPRSEYDKASVRLAGTVQISPKLTANASANYLNSGGERPVQGPGLFGGSGGYLVSLLNWPRNDDTRNYLNPDGTRRRLLGAATSAADADNPYFTVERNPQTDRTNRFIGNASLNFAAFKWLSFGYTLGTDFYQERVRSVRAVGTSLVNNQDGGIAETTNANRILNSNFLATLSHQFNENFRGTLTLGNTIEQNQNETTNIIGLIFQNPNFVSINNTVNRNALTSNVTRRLVGNFGQLSLVFLDQLFVELSGRYDLSSTLPRPDQNKTFGRGFGYGSIGAGYEFTRTLGLEQNPILNYGKIRASVAEVGKDTGPYRVESPLAANTYIGGGFRNGFFGSNRLLIPERTRSYEAGLELRFLQNRLGLDANVYYTRTTDQLIAPRVSQATGFILQYINGGTVENRGLEISLNGSPVKTPKFNWDVNANFYRNKNKTVELPSVLTVVYQSDAFIIDNAQGGAFPGRPLTSIGASDWQRAPDGRILINPTTGYPLVNNTFTYQGNRAPDFTTQITNTLTYKDLQLTFLFDFRKGGKVVNGNDWFATRTGLSERTTDRFKEVVFDGVIATPNSDGSTSYVANTRPVELTQGYYQNILGTVGSAFIEDGSWTRLRYATLSYALPSSVFGRSFVKGVELSVTGRNLLLLTNYSGADPETSAAGAGVRGGGSNGFDYGSVPATRGVDMGIRVTF
ncbi:TonB-dependent receptor plug [Hymenobacter roseosalivarius DSM 11622]|uniref:TonB-dependent receptor plug n=1 Tax=Hymenobacter roseosalivarius DSM 11622 TaxID=645990 RepID=A0A1W1VX98_9BACT|nr:SusC/RagA family TonB-linked outer membrane protein [Hymenobacter roseosalivarius]SMB97731.1 TonB-dependent receptor plug [Hymenobacter roseosalivarius DSM 11622]